MQDLWQEVLAHSCVYSKLWSFGIRYLCSRECSLYEASDLLLGDHLFEKSTTIKWIDVSPCHNRKRQLRNPSKLVEIWERNPDSTDIFLMDNFYPELPDDMEEVCLYDLPSTRNVVKTVMGIPFTRNLTNTFFQTTGCTTQPRKRNGRTTTTLCFSSLFPSATKHTSSKRERLLRVLLNSIWSRMMN